MTVEIEAGPGRLEVLGRGGPTMRIHRPDEFYARIGRDGLIGFGEAYLTGAWDTAKRRTWAASSPCSPPRSRP